MEYTNKEFLEEIKNIIGDYAEYLASLGLELDEYGNVVEKDTKKLVLKVDDEDE